MRRILQQSHRCIINWRLQLIFEKEINSIKYDGDFVEFLRKSGVYGDDLEAKITDKHVILEISRRDISSLGAICSVVFEIEQAMGGLQLIESHAKHE